ncbi:uncharacterized protein METZ01_LOCUS508044 [marine metagenome]|uniref:Uncharacterized protein n=1 Tax=marine metagenome TaxID=408172 RepID=A0A383EFS5_9ZZZZ
MSPKCKQAVLIIGWCLLLGGFFWWLAP